MTLRRAALVGLSFAFAGCVMDVPPDEASAFDGELGELEQGVQSEYRGSASPQFDYAAWTDEVQASAAIFVPMFRNGSPLYQGSYRVRGTCGLTFVTGRYAITAAHCVSSGNVFDPPNQPLRVEQAHNEWCALPKLQTAEALWGRFPDYRNTPVTEADYCYRTTYTQCHVIKRCSAYYGKYNCNEIADADIALIRCDDRPKDAASVPVAASDAETGPVEHTWYHEVFSVVTQQPTPPTADDDGWVRFFYEQNKDQYEHYTLYNAVENNYHYIEDGQQLFPLRAKPWPDGTPHRRIYRSGTVVWTDLFGCHGTSGSGIFQRNADNKLELLGPTINGASAWTGSRLCTDPTNTSAYGPGKANLSYTRTEFTRALAQWAWRQENPIIHFPPDRIDRSL